MANAKKITMDDLLKDNEESFKKVNTGDTVKGTDLSVKKHEILIQEKLDTIKTKREDLNYYDFTLNEENITAFIK